ncbi:hypothetical protein ES703_117875 [subsurface metagenome]
MPKNSKSKDVTMVGGKDIAHPAGPRQKPPKADPPETEPTKTSTPNEPEKTEQ